MGQIHYFLPDIPSKPDALHGYVQDLVTKPKTETLYIQDQDETETFNLQDRDETRRSKKCLETETQDQDVPKTYQDRSFAV